MNLGIFINKVELSLSAGCHIVRKHRVFLDTCRLTKPNVSSSFYSCDLPHEISRNFNRRSISVFCSSTDSVDLTTKPDLEDEGASRNEESIEENNVEFVEQAMIDEASDFQRKIMRDSDDLNWRWKPDGCDLPCNIVVLLCWLLWRSKIKAMWMLDVTTPSMESQMSVDFAQLFTNSSLYQSNQNFIKKLSIPPPRLKYLYFRTKYSQPFLTQTKACFLKQYWSNWRHPQYNAIRFLMTILASCWEQDMNNSFGAMYAAILFLGATNAATPSLMQSLRWPWKLCTTRYNGVYALIIYSIIGYDWTVAKSMGSACPSSLSLWNLFSGLLRARPVRRKKRYGGDGTTAHTPVAWTLYLQIAGVGDMSLKTLLKYGFGFEHDFLPVVAAVHIG
ncbi:BnaC09g33730D [Brassica napus]|uniref:BnaC09g33730D protein n=1 Tax=Brassica napus TaxID=3708 RepID=A0A078HZ37_BRANA|nr:BnaC09g33730D [Brassica napus]